MHHRFNIRTLTVNELLIVSGLLHPITLEDGSVVPANPTLAWLMRPIKAQALYTAPTADGTRFCRIHYLPRKEGIRALRVVHSRHPTARVVASIIATHTYYQLPPWRNCPGCQGRGCPICMIRGMVVAPVATPETSAALPLRKRIYTVDTWIVGGHDLTDAAPDSFGSILVPARKGREQQ